MDVASQQKTAEQVGEAFVGQYYTLFSTNAKQLAIMYNNTSVFCHAPMSSALQFTYGKEAISKKLAQEDSEIKFKLHTAEFVPSINGSVMIMVQGNKLTHDAVCSFYHTFLLGHAHGSYYIHNDIMRLCDPEEDDDWEEESEEEPAAPPAPPAPTPVAEKPKATPASVPKAAAPTPTPTKPTPEPTPTEKVEKKEAKVETPKKEAVEEEKPAEKQPFSSWANMLTGSKAAASVSEHSKVARVVGGAVPTFGGKKAPKETKGTKGAKGAKGDKGKKGDRAEKGEAKGAKEGKGTKDRDVNYSFYSLYVAHLPVEFKESDIDEIFGKFGDIKGKTYQDSRVGGGGKRCYIDYDSKEAMEAALSGDVTFKGVTLQVQERKSPAQRLEEKGSRDKKDLPPRRKGAAAARTEE